MSATSTETQRLASKLAEPRQLDRSSASARQTPPRSEVLALIADARAVCSMLEPVMTSSSAKAHLRLRIVASREGAQAVRKLGTVLPSGWRMRICDEKVPGSLLIVDRRSVLRDVAPGGDEGGWHEDWRKAEAAARAFTSWWRAGVDMDTGRETP